MRRSSLDLSLFFHDQFTCFLVASPFLSSVCPLSPTASPRGSRPHVFLHFIFCTCFLWPHVFLAVHFIFFFLHLLSLKLLPPSCFSARRFLLALFSSTFASSFFFSFHPPISPWVVCSFALPLFATTSPSPSLLRVPSSPPPRPFLSSSAFIRQNFPSMTAPALLLIAAVPVRRLMCARTARLFCDRYLLWYLVFPSVFCRVMSQLIGLSLFFDTSS